MLAMIEEDERTSWSAWDRDPGPRKRLASSRHSVATVSATCTTRRVAGFARSTILLMLGWLAWNTLPFPRRYGVFRRLFRRLWFDAVTL